MSTIRTVAERAGVSLKTVSRAFSAPASVSAKTLARVLTAAEQLDFVPDRRAQAMRSGRSGVIGLLTDVAGSTPCSSEILRGVEEALAERGLSLLIGNMESRSESSNAIVRSFRAGRVEGVIYASTYHREVADFEPPQIPGVLVNCFSRHARLPTIIPDEEAGGHAVGAHLVALGHRRVAYLTLHPTIEATRLRLQGLTRAMTEAGLDSPGDLVATAQSRTGAFDQEEAFAAALAMLSRPDRPTAVFCGNDEMAMQVYYAAASCGLSVPADLSVVGFDDNRLFSEGLRPGLTTVALRYVAMGRLAVDLLLDGSVGSPAVTRVPGELVLRQSTAQAAALPA